jgi:Family of unknown function (DUF6116)
MNPATLMNIFLEFANQLKFKNLFLLILCLFIIDIIVPDMIPMIDEIILGLLTVLLANWKKGKGRDKQENFINGEIIDEEDK